MCIGQFSRPKIRLRGLIECGFLNDCTKDSGKIILGKLKVITQYSNDLFYKLFYVHLKIKFYITCKEVIQNLKLDGEKMKIHLPVASDLSCASKDLPAAYMVHLEEPSNK